MGGTVTDLDPIAFAPKAWLDFVLPPKPMPVAPWDRQTSAAPIPAIGRMSVLERARLYLAQVDPAVQGSGGHNALLWAARCLVVGFELDEASALSLLWCDYNPRCTPPWNAESEVDRKDFERKVSQAKETPPGKRPGWLLDEFGLRDADSAARALGESSAAALLASARKRAEIAPETFLPELKPPPPKPPATGEWKPFPLEYFPDPIRDYCLQLSESQVVDPSFVALPILTVAGAAMGNAWRLELKEDTVEPPLLWAVIVGGPGSNKTRSLKLPSEPLFDPLPIDAIGDPILNPQARSDVDNATLEAVLVRLGESARGVFLFKDEIKGWIKSFGKTNKKGDGGADEAAWNTFWNGGRYTVDRKTNNEHVSIPAAAVSVLGGIQPKVLGKLFNEDLFESGFVSRVLLAYPPSHDSPWNENVVDKLAGEKWRGAVTWLRCTPFVGRDAKGKWLPRVIPVGADTPAKMVYTEFHNLTGKEMHERGEDGRPRLDDDAVSFLSKSRTYCVRLALIHHGLRLACGSRAINEPLGVQSMRAGVAWARWFRDEQLRCYGFATTIEKAETAKEAVEYLVSAILKKLPTRSATIGQLTRLNHRRYVPRERAIAAMSLAVEHGYAHWEDATHKKIVLDVNDEGAKP